MIALLLWFTFGLAVVGFVMVTSASMPVGQRLAEDPFLFAKRDGIYMIVALCLCISDNASANGGMATLQ